MTEISNLFFDAIKGQLNSEWIYEVIFPESQPKFTKISDLPSNRLPGQKSW